ncbi:MAG: MFS transporter [Acidobacteria bacterium]|nr:MFS transporter [Acidobacteriota bacterium]
MNWGLDFSPLRVSSAFRRLYAAGFITGVGSQATYVTIAYQMKSVTGSPLAVGLIGLVELLPLIVFGLYGGVLADRFDRRRLIVGGEVGLLLCAVVLLLNARRESPSSLVLYVIVALTSTADGLQRPSWTATMQQVVDHQRQKSASTLSMVRFTLTAIIGPVLGGFLSVTFGPDAVYLIDVVTFIFSIGLLVGISVPAVSVRETAPSLIALRHGVRYAVSRPDLIGTYLIDLAAMILAFPVSMMPFFADHFSETFALPLLYAAMPAGAMLGSLTSRWTDRLHFYGRGIAVAATAWGVGVAVFGASPFLWLAFGGLLFAGAADAISAILRSALWNMSIPLEVRGRMAGIELLSYAVGPTAGQFRAGAMTAAFGVRTALTSGGVMCAVICGALPAALPALWRFDVRTDPHVAAVAASRSKSESSES